MGAGGAGAEVMPFVAPAIPSFQGTGDLVETPELCRGLFAVRSLTAWP